jgi:FtsZ-interacting cell division protein ZipA
MSDTTTIILVVVGVLVVLAVIAAVAMARNKKNRRRKAEAGRLRERASADSGTIPQEHHRAREAEQQAEHLRREARRAEHEAERARRGAQMEEARHEDRLREADRLDPDVDHRAEDYEPGARRTDGGPAHRG